jgi:uncharacterized protein
MYLELLLIPLVIILIAQGMVSGAYRKYRTVQNQRGLTGQEVARRILDLNGLENVYVVETKGIMSDHYDPRKKVIRLSSEVFHEKSIASVSIAAHECGHAIQDKNHYAFIKIRALMVPFVGFTSKIGYFVILVGFITAELNIAMIGLMLLATTLLFQLVTLPVEFDASNRAKAILLDQNMIKEDEESKVKAMLNAAAMTYVAALLANFLEMLRLFLIITRGRR